jgi:hypothetical protein
MSDELDILACKFFKLFARYEYGLKQKNYTIRKEINRFSIDWDKWANEEVGRDFLACLGTKKTLADYILDNPPMRQELNDSDEVVWTPVDSSDKSVQALFGHIRRMRNNLFHGSKFNNTWFDPSRSKKLLENGLGVLEHFQDKAVAEEE